MNTQEQQHDLPGGFSWVIDNKLAGMKFPSSESDYSKLIPLNIGLVVCLNEVLPSFHKTAFSSTNESETPIVLHVSVNDYGVPDNFDKFDKMVELVQQTLDSNKAVVCHCMAGLSRTGMALACILVTLNDQMSAEDAVQLVYVTTLFLFLYTNPQYSNKTRGRGRAVMTFKQEDYVKSYVEYRRNKYSE
jgi:atypical dual specificity phosphatase